MPGPLVWAGIALVGAGLALGVSGGRRPRAAGARASAAGLTLGPVEAPDSAASDGMRRWRAWSPPWGRPPRCCGRSGRARRCSRCASSRCARACRAAPCTRSPSRWPRKACWTSSRGAGTGSARCSSGSRGRSSSAPGWSRRSRGPRRCGARPARRCTSASWSAPGWCTCTGRPGRCARRWTTGSACARPRGAAGAARRRCRGSRPPRSTSGSRGCAGKRTCPPPTAPPCTPSWRWPAATAGW